MHIAETFQYNSSNKQYTQKCIRLKQVPKQIDMTIQKNNSEIKMLFKF